MQHNQVETTIKNIQLDKFSFAANKTIKLHYVYACAANWSFRQLRR